MIPARRGRLPEGELEGGAGRRMEVKMQVETENPPAADAGASRTGRSGARGAARNRCPGRLRVTVRPHYEGPPFGGQYAQDERVQTSRAQDLETSLSWCPKHSPRSKIAAVERREADVPRHGT